MSKERAHKLPAWLLPGPRKKYTTAQRKKRKAALKATIQSRARSRPKKLGRRKRTKPLHRRKQR